MAGPALARRRMPVEHARTWLRERDARAPGVPSRTIEDLLADAFTAGLAQLHVVPPRLATTVGARPVASPLARWQATHRDHVTNLRQESVRIGDAAARQILSAARRQPRFPGARRCVGPDACRVRPARPRGSNRPAPGGFRASRPALRILIGIGARAHHFSRPRAPVTLAIAASGIAIARRRATSYPRCPGHAAATPRAGDSTWTHREKSPSSPAPAAGSAGVALALLRDGYAVALAGRRTDRSRRRPRSAGVRRPRSGRAHRRQRSRRGRRSSHGQGSSAGSTCCSTTPAPARRRFQSRNSPTSSGRPSSTST